MSSSTDSRVLIYVQHLLGVGHLQRALLLAAALRDQGLRVMVVSGGRPTSLPRPQGVLFEQLAPLHSADASFARLLDANNKPVDDTWRAARQQTLMGIYRDFAPQALITETFPFGRRMLRFELLPLLQACRDSRQLVIASIRDILQPRSKPERERETCDWIDSYYDHVLVHGDPRIATLDDCFSMAQVISDKCFYSGYISASAHSTAPGDDGRGEVLVSGGGSATGLRLLRTALRARPLSDCRELCWRLLVSPAIDAEHFLALQQDAAGDEQLVVERNRPDFSVLLQRARLSISQAGYNTMTDLLNSNAASVVVPYAQANEVEQSLRAQALQKRGRVVALAETDLSPRALAQAMKTALRQDNRLSVDLDGATRSAQQVLHWLETDGVGA